MKLTQQDLDFILNLKGKLIYGEVVDIKIGYSTSLIVSNKDAYYNISIGNSEIFIESQKSLIKVEDIVSKLTLSKLFKSSISSLVINDDGELTIGFDNNSKKIITKPGLDYEAWEINGPDGFQGVCMPGGKLAYWMK